MITPSAWRIFGGMLQQECVDLYGSFGAGVRHAISEFNSNDIRSIRKYIGLLIEHPSDEYKFEAWICSGAEIYPMKKDINLFYECLLRDIDEVIEKKGS